MQHEHLLYQNKKATPEPDYKLLGIFGSLLIASLFLCDVFIFKTISIFGFQIALSGFLFPVTSLLMICVNEIYGHKKAAITLVNLIAAQIVFLLGLVFLPKIPSPPHYAPELVTAYNAIFKNEWRVFISSPIGIAVTLYLSSIINSKLKTFFWGKYLMLRMMITSIITTAVLVSLIYPINFYNILTWKQIFNICIDTYLYKIIMAFAIVYLSYPIVFFGKKIEKKYIFDINIKFSPLCIYSSKSAGVNLYDELPT